MPCEDVPGAAHRKSPPSVWAQEDLPLGGAQGLRPWAPRGAVTGAPQLDRGPREVSERSGELRGAELARGPGEGSENSGELRGVEPVRGLQTAPKLAFKPGFGW
jgi:hypothetical protein